MIFLIHNEQKAFPVCSDAPVCAVSELQIIL